ncbi:MAG TPA: glycosyltransferase family 39 protein [Clostridia bacterium]|nr:glycosyltransferase family 39 protein [Clostridia bacterium]
MATVESTNRLEVSRAQQLSFACARVADAIERNPVRTLIAISVIYFAITFIVSGFRLFWFDELITYYIAKVNNVRGIWDALSRGADPNPPLMHILVMWSMRLFGNNQIAARLPAILAEWLGVICLFLFLRKRVPVVYAAAGVFFFIATRAFDYAYESRSYALTLGFAMLSLVLWRSAVEGRHRIIASVGLAITLAAGISSNYFAVLAFFPIAVGELVRNFETRKIELRVWLALAAGGLPMLFYIPLINHAVAQFGPYAWNKPNPDFLFDSYDSMIDLVFYPALALFEAGLVIYIYQRTSEGRVTPPVLPRHELAAVMTQMAYPLIGYAIAVARAGMISPRFVLPMCYGFAIAVAVTGYRLFSRTSVGAMALLFVCFSWALARNAQSASELLEQREAFYNVQNSLPAEGTIVVSDSLLALPLYYYSPPQLSSRIVFPVDFDAIRRYKREDSPEQNLWAGRNIFPIRIQSLKGLARSTPKYVIVATRDNWLLQKLSAEGTPAEPLPIDIGSRHIGGFTPLCHGEAFLFEKGPAFTSDSRHPHIRTRPGHSRALRLNGNGNRTP